MSVNPGQPVAITQAPPRAQDIEAEADTLPPTPRKDAAVLETGTVIASRYEVESLCGVGGSGVVYRVRDRLNPERPVALKTMRGTVLGDVGQEMFRSEFQMLTGLLHPNLGRVHEYGEVDDGTTSFFTMDFLSGGHLLDATEGSDWRTVVRHVVSVCRALSYLHSQDLIHFDIKPLNVLLDERGTARVVDFGLCGPRPTGRALSLLATPLYTAPELVLMNRPPDHRVDLYALGISLYQLLVRRPPFQGISAGEVMQQHLKEPIRFPPDFWMHHPSWLVDLIRWMTAKQADERPFSADQIIERINEVGDEDFEVQSDATSKVYVFASRFVGREQELQTVTEFVIDRLDPRAPEKATLLVSGPPGAGKTRLLAEARVRTLDRQALLLGVQCQEDERDPLAPVRRIFRQLCHSSIADREAEFFHQWADTVAAFSPDAKGFLTRMGVSHEPQSTSPPSAEQAADCLVALGHRCPCVLVFDRLELASPEVWQFVGHLTKLIAVSDRRSAPTRLAFLGARRSEDATLDPSQSLHAALSEHVCRVELSPLSESTVSALLTSMLGATSLPSSVVSTVFELSRGNPFFAEEAVKAFADDRILVRRQGQWSISAAQARAQVPKSLEAIFSRRLRGLPEHELELLRALSISAEPLELDVLRSVSSHDAGTVYRALMSLHRKGLVRHSAEDETYELEHPVTRSVVIEGLWGQTLRAFHRRLAAALLDAADAAGDSIGGSLQARAARYLAEAGLVADAVRLACEAVRRLVSGGHSDQALVPSRDAIRWMDEISAWDRERYGALLLHERLCETTGQHDEQHRTLNALSALEPSLTGLNRATIALRRGDHLAISGKVGAEEAYLRALEIFQSLQDAVGERDVHRQIGFLRWRQGNFEAAIEQNRRALEIDRQRRDRVGAARDLVNIGICFRGLDRREDAKQSFEQALSVYRKAVHEEPGSADPSVYSQLTFSLGNLLRDEKEFENAITLYEESVECLPESAGPMRATGYNAIANTLMQVGRVEEAISWWGKVAELGKLTTLGPEISAAVKLGNTLLALGRYEEAIPHLGEAASAYERADDIAREAATRRTIGDIYSKRLRKPTEARSHYATAYSLASFGRVAEEQLRAADGLLRCGPAAGMPLDELLEVCETAIRVAADSPSRRLRFLEWAGASTWKGGRYQAALRYYEQGLEEAQSADCAETTVASFYNGVAACLKALGDRERAVAAFLTAIGFHRRAGLTTHEAQAHHALGNLLAGGGDPRTGMEHLRSSARLREELDDRVARVQVGCDLALLHAQLGEMEQATSLASDMRTLAGDDLASLKECDALDKALTHQSRSGRSTESG